MESDTKFGLGLCAAIVILGCVVFGIVKWNMIQSPDEILWDKINHLENLVNQCNQLPKERQIMPDCLQANIDLIETRVTLIIQDSQQK